MERAKRYSRPLTVVYIDIDDFKRVNDVHGHTIGDELLRKVGLSLKSIIRTTDYAARLGGDEFAVLLTEATKEGAQGFVERLHKGLTLDVPYAVTFSMGAVTFNTPPESVDTLLEPADAMMYAAKKNGKNALLFSDAVGVPISPGREPARA
jgi:diguanylate cyclase (GGDEF)-like protein